MLAIVVNFDIHPGTEDQAIATLEANAAGSRQEPGCLRWEWSRHSEDASKFAIYELYVDEAAIQAHRESEHFAQWRADSPKFMASKTSGVYRVDGQDPRTLAAAGE